MSTNIYIQLMDGNAEGFQAIVDDTSEQYGDTPCTLTAVDVDCIGGRNPATYAVFMQDREWKDGFYEGGYHAFLDMLEDSLGKIPELIGKYVEDEDFEEAKSLIEGAITVLIVKLESLKDQFKNKQIFLHMS